jgi:type IV secretory pathway VirB10-like protein
MAFSEKTILSPEPSKPGIPLKRATVIGLLVVLLVLAMIAALLMPGGSDVKSSASPVAKDSNELKQIGSEQALQQEKDQALAKRSVASAPVFASPAAPPGEQGAGAHTVAQGPLPSSALPASALRGINPPAGVMRTDNSGALYAGGVRRGVANTSEGDDGSLQTDAQARISKSMVLDDSSTEGSARERPPAERRQSVTELQMPTGAPAPSAGLNAQIDAIKAQLSGQQLRPANWLNEYAQESAQPRDALRARPATPGFVLRKGKVIPAVTERMLNSDLPGAITARVRENVYDAQGNLLIPFGSTLVGRYDSQIKIGQERVLFAFSDLILPNGVTFKLPAAAGSDLAGAAGVTGDVNNHFFKMFGTSLLIAVLADRTRQPESVTSFGGNPAITAAGQVLADTSRTVLQRNQNLSPTITVDQGTRINVEVVADMVFTSHYAQKVAK